MIRLRLGDVPEDSRIDDLLDERGAISSTMLAVFWSLL